MGGVSFSAKAISCFILIVYRLFADISLASTRLIREYSIDNNINARIDLKHFNSKK